MTIEPGGISAREGEKPQKFKIHFFGKFEFFENFINFYQQFMSSIPRVFTQFVKTINAGILRIVSAFKRDQTCLFKSSDSNVFSGPILLNVLEWVVSDQAVYLKMGTNSRMFRPHPVY